MRVTVAPDGGGGGDDDGGGSGSGGAVSYGNCSDVRAAGADPIRAGEPGYGRHLDRDGDGVGCE
ncbi:excalibur calcium-binding domain-containing protein [Streptomyces zhihengii]|uniref:excalibur calcium-binding domain-containing protein n=1 Tax=Streptomyces zhihengii TaxID=1818004 RepID=UPI0027DBF0A6|nr:excalibur calcium-binding domain-containing protein [Streptomyces zhihengii]